MPEVVLHRDVKPSNIFLDAQGNVKVSAHKTWWGCSKTKKTHTHTHNSLVTLAWQEYYRHKVNLRERGSAHHSTCHQYEENDIYFFFQKKKFISFV